MSKELNVAVEAAREAGEVLRASFAGGASPYLGRRQHFDAKGSPIDLVTEFDRRAEEVIVQRLHTAFPNDVILAEESGLQHGSGASARWLVDPLDGTTNFAHGLPWF